jgi:coproporphyrinogen III oxidase
MTRWIERIHDRVTRMFEGLDRGGRFHEDPWERPGGGGGVTRVLNEGRTFEKVGVNRAAVHGPLPAAVARELGVDPDTDDRSFFATGVSVVAHPRSPMVPIVHLNVRYFELLDGDGHLQDRWFGGGADLTPTYPHPRDAVTFHRSLRDLCNRHDRIFYPRFKKVCDRYFVNRHRSGEMRGVGGIFFDHLRPGVDGRSFDELRAFVGAVGLSLESAYVPVVNLRRDEAYGPRERDFQLFRRGRYVEFNLVHDRGTRFGLLTDARVESVLMSLPPLARWSYAPSFGEGSFEARLMDMLEPREWANGVDDVKVTPFPLAGEALSA